MHNDADTYIRKSIYKRFGRLLRPVATWVLILLMALSLVSCTEANPFPFPEKIESDASSDSGEEDGTSDGNTEGILPGKDGTDSSGGSDPASGASGADETDGGVETEIPSSGEPEPGADGPLSGDAGSGTGNDVPLTGSSGDAESAEDVVVERPLYVGSDAVFLEAGGITDIEIPAGNRAWAVLLNSGEDWTDGDMHDAKYTVEAPVDKALGRYSVTSPGYEYYAGAERLVWRDMNRCTGGTCDAYEFGRDDDAGIIFMIDASMASEYADNAKALVTTLYGQYPRALPDNVLRNAETLAGMTPATLYSENGIRYLLVLFTDFGYGSENTYGVYSTACQILGTCPSVNVNGRAFTPSERAAWDLGTTVAHEYSHFLESYGRQRATGRPGFGCHLTAEGYADWSAMKSTGRSPLSEANYLAFWLEDGNLWHPVKELVSSDDIPLRMADYGLGCLFWDKLYTDNGIDAVRDTIGYTGGDLGGFERSTGMNFGIWFREAVMDVLESVGMTGYDDASEEYLDGYRLDWIWNVVTDYLGPAEMGTTTVSMTSTGIRVVPLPEGTWAFGYEGADECVLFSLPKPE